MTITTTITAMNGSKKAVKGEGGKITMIDTVNYSLKGEDCVINLRQRDPSELKGKSLRSEMTVVIS